MDDRVFASRDMTEAMSLNDRIDTIGVVDIFAVDDAQKPSLFLIRQIISHPAGNLPRNLREL